MHKTEENDHILLRFEHPTVAGAATGGWMEVRDGDGIPSGELTYLPQRLKMMGQDIRNPTFGDSAPTSTKVIKTEEISFTKPGVTRKITMMELKKQDKKKPWFVVNGQVYDATPFLNEHPGGDSSILIVAGEDASEDFLAIHSTEARARLAEVRSSYLKRSRLTGHSSTLERW